MTTANNQTMVFKLNSEPLTASAGKTVLNIVRKQGIRHAIVKSRRQAEAALTIQTKTTQQERTR